MIITPWFLSKITQTNKIAYFEKWAPLFFGIKVQKTLHISTTEWWWHEWLLSRLLVNFDLAQEIELYNMFITNRR